MTTPQDRGLRESRGDGGGCSVLSVPDMRCFGCIGKIEAGLTALDGVRSARANLGIRRVTVHWDGDCEPPFIDTLDGLGFKAHEHQPDLAQPDETLSRLIRALAVAGFATGNIMMLSISVWSGADAGTREIFHWISALIAVPTLAYSGQVFFKSAWRALRRGTTNMDVPISVGVLVTFLMSLSDTLRGGDQVYFDAGVMLLFFLLIGRTLDHAMQEKARNAVAGLSRLIPPKAMIEHPDGTRAPLAVDRIDPGMRVIIAAGARIPVDGTVEEGASEIDRSIVSGESLPCAVAPGDTLLAGTLNLTSPLTLRATARAGESYLAEIRRMLEEAEAGRSRYRRIADRAARLYSPVVHLAALLTFIGWFTITGEVYHALTIAVAVLIITCPCALGLAVPMVQTVAARRLLEEGVLVRDGAAMERLATIDTVVFDKTGTLTSGHPHLVNGPTVSQEHLDLAGAIAAYSRHPYSTALTAIAGTQSKITFDHIEEIAGSGVLARSGAVTYRLGRSDWAASVGHPDGEKSSTVLSKDGETLAVFEFEHLLQVGADKAVATLREAGLRIEMLSGDARLPVQRVAAQLGIDHWVAGATPAAKIEHLRALRASGHGVLMVGDGLNDVAALAAASVSMAPVEAADIGRAAADFVLVREDLNSIPRTLQIARRSAHLVRQNFAMAVGYNALAIPFAVLGYVSPLVAALAMSGSSLLVTINALRLNGSGRMMQRNGRSDRVVHPPAQERTA